MMELFFEMINCIIGTVCFAGAILAFVLAGSCFFKKDVENTILGAIVGIFGIVLLGLFFVAFFTV